MLKIICRPHLASCGPEKWLFSVDSSQCSSASLAPKRIVLATNSVVINGYTLFPHIRLTRMVAAPAGLGKSYPLSAIQRWYKGRTAWEGQILSRGTVSQTCSAAISPFHKGWSARLTVPALLFSAFPRALSNRSWHTLSRPLNASSGVRPAPQAALDPFCGSAGFHALALAVVD